MKTTPHILGEDETLDRALAGKSISRFADGELHLAVGHPAVSQRPHPGLQLKLKTILKHADSGNALVCIPAIDPNSPKGEQWRRFYREPYRALYNFEAVHGSPFITRADCCPWINTPEYWGRMEQLWRGREVVLVRGSGKGFVKADLESHGCDCEEILAPRQHAFEEFDALFRRLRKEKRRVILCLGATATALAYFLGGEGVHALDMGHAGMFARRAGRFPKRKDKDPAFEGAAA